jgi:hypothetical protein
VQISHVDAVRQQVKSNGYWSPAYFDFLGSLAPPIDDRDIVTVAIGNVDLVGKGIYGDRIGTRTDRYIPDHGLSEKRRCSQQKQEARE